MAKHQQRTAAQVTAPIQVSPLWLRILMVLLGGPNVIIGLWAFLAPQSWFDTFPGWAPRIVAAYPPFNHHLASDAGLGLFASGVVFVLAALWPQRQVVITAAIAYLAFVLPHFLYHIINPSDLMTGSENITNSISLASSVVGAGVVLLWQRRLQPVIN